MEEELVEERARLNYKPSLRKLEASKGEQYA